MSRQGILLVVSGPSGTGKGTICNKVMNRHPLNYSISITTRAPREGEVDGKDYFFVSKKEFEYMISNNQLLEYAQVYDNYYGTPRKYVLDQLNSGLDILLEIEMNGAYQVKQKFRDGVFVFVLPPSLDELHKRIKKRGKDSEETIKKRMELAASEIAHAVQYDYIVINDNLEKAVNQIDAILVAEKTKVKRNADIIEKIRYGYPDLGRS